MTRAAIGKLCAWDRRRGKGKMLFAGAKATNRGKIGTDRAAFNDDGEKSRLPLPAGQRCPSKSDFTQFLADIAASRIP